MRDTDKLREGCRSWVPFVEAPAGSLLLGGVRIHTASRFESLDVARDWT